MSKTKALLADTAFVIKSPAPAKKARKPRKTRAQRFWEKVDQTKDASSCWLWTAAVFPSTGYPQVWDSSPITGKKTMRSAHKVAFELEHGTTLEPGAIILHSRYCVSRTCCRPSHLRRGTLSENSFDAAALGTLSKRKLTAAKAREIVARYRGHDGFATHTKAQLAKLFATTPQNIEHVVKGRRWSKATGVGRHEDMRLAA